MTSTVINDDIKWIAACLPHGTKMCFFSQLAKFGQAGKAILTGHRDEPVYPTTEDMVVIKTSRRIKGEKIITKTNLVKYVVQVQNLYQWQKKLN